VTVLFVLALLAWLASCAYFWHCTGQDVDSWDTPWKQFTHPYRLRTQLLLFPVLLGWMFPLLLWDWR
jgi:hypothetical protein